MSTNTVATIARLTLAAGSILWGGKVLPAASPVDQPRLTQAKPLLIGNWADPTVLKDGDDYYMTHSSFDFQPGLLVWHSKDLRTWRPISHAVVNQEGSIWARTSSSIRGDSTSTTLRPARTGSSRPTRPAGRGPRRDPLIHRQKGGSSFGLVSLLKSLLQLDADLYLSGHAEPVDKQAVAGLLTQIEQKQTKLKVLVAEGKQLNDVKEAFGITDPPVGGRRWPSLVEVIYRELTERNWPCANVHRRVLLRQQVSWSRPSPLLVARQEPRA